MKSRKRARRKKRNTGKLIALAVLCLLGSELIACRLCAPDLFRKVTAPVLWAWEQLRGAGEALVERLPEWPPVQEEPPAEQELDVSQLAGDPLLETERIIADPAVTRLKVVDGQELLTGNGKSTVYFNQGDAAWASLPYGRDNIGRYGCGPTAMAMVVASMTDVETDPARMAQWAVERRHWAPGSGSYLSIVEGAASAHGLTATPLTERTPEAIENALLTGKLLVALMGPGHFTNGGHFIVLRGITLGGEVLVADPNSLDRSLTTWDPQLILDELSHSTTSGAPLWEISAPA